MLVRTANEFRQALARLTTAVNQPVTPSAVFMVEPSGFSISEETARDNVYMNLQADVDADLAIRQFRGLVQLIRDHGVEVQVFPGHKDTPDGVFPNNVFGTAPGRMVIGRMCYPGRQRESERSDISQWLLGQGRELHDLRSIEGVAELTGALIIDRARRVGFCGLSERADEAGAKAMHDAFELDLTYSFDLAPGEYHTNVVMSVLAGRACVLQAGALADPQAPGVIADAFPDRTLFISEQEKNHFAGNCIALTDRDVFMSTQAADYLQPDSRRKLESMGFAIRSTDLSELEKAGGSLRCMVGEVF